MKYYLHPLVILMLIIPCSSCMSQEKKDSSRIIPGAERTGLYFEKLRGKRVAVVANHTSLVAGTGLIDTLIRSGIAPAVVFSPEHGFGGEQEAGEKVGNQHYRYTQIPVVSLYGKNYKPKSRDLEGIDLVVFDIQDVGVRFYTYISTLTYVMEACAENRKPLLVLDRPNPHGYYIDGPVLDMKYRSFVGMHPIPVVYGLTEGELALMINGEGWLKNHVKCDLTVIPVENYTHTSFYELPVRPSPNLPDMRSVMLYPSLCLFEGTIMSVGRGTDKPFKIFGHPAYSPGDYTFTPKKREGTTLAPLYENQVCRGHNLSLLPDSLLGISGKLSLQWLMESYRFFKTESYFNNYFDQLAGNSKLRKQIMEGLTEYQIRETWKNELNQYNTLRSKYLLYKDSQ